MSSEVQQRVDYTFTSASDANALLMDVVELILNSPISDDANEYGNVENQ